jgi:hypothetical protein
MLSEFNFHPVVDERSQQHRLANADGALGARFDFNALHRM